MDRSLGGRVVGFGLACLLVRCSADNPAANDGGAGGSSTLPQSGGAPSAGNSGTGANASGGASTGGSSGGGASARATSTGGASGAGTGSGADAGSDVDGDVPDASTSMDAGDAGEDGGAETLPMVECNSGLPNESVKFESTVGLAPLVAPLPLLPGVSAGVYTAMVSRDGSTVAGEFVTEYRVHTPSNMLPRFDALFHLFRFSGGKFTDLGMPSGYLSTGVPVALDCTGKSLAADLIPVVSSTAFAEGWALGIDRAFHWTESTGFTALPAPSSVTLTDESTLEVSGMTADGKAILGSYYNYATGYGFSLRWVGNGVPESFAGTVNSKAGGFNADGSVFYGGDTRQFTPDYNLPSVWSRRTPFVHVGAPELHAQIAAMSADGNYVVGLESPPDGGSDGFIWGAAGDSKDLGAVQPHAVSRGGHVVVGILQPALIGDGDWDFVWDRAHGIRSLRTILAAKGAAIPAGYVITDVSGISDDGRVLVGIIRSQSTVPGAYNAFRAVVPAGTFD